MATPGLDEIVQWDIRNWSKALPFWQKFISKEKTLNCLAIGEREGGLALWLALQGHQVTCSDLKDTEKTASPLHNKYGVKDKVSYLDMDATQIPAENQFDLIVFKSILGGVGHNDQKHLQEKALHEMYKALKPGGILLFAENLSGSALHRYLRKKYIKWGGKWRYVSKSELKEMLSPFSTLHLSTYGLIATFGRSEAQRNMLGAFDSMLTPLTPSAWHYICFGAAIK